MIRLLEKFPINVLFYHKIVQFDCTTCAFFFTVALDLINNEIEILNFNKNRLAVQMDKDQMFRKMSKLGIKGPDNLKHI